MVVVVAMVCMCVWVDEVGGLLQATLNMRGTSSTVPGELMAEWEVTAERKYQLSMLMICER